MPTPQVLLERITWAESALEHAKFILQNNPTITEAEQLRAETAIQEATEWLTGQNDGRES
jgi:hypothetical protein